MSSNDYDAEEINQLTTIGKQVKLAYPGEFNGFNDFDVGETSVLKGLWPLKSDSINSSPRFFLEWRIQRKLRRAEYIVSDLRLDQIVAEAELDASLHPRRMAQRIYLEEQALQLQAQNNRLLAKTQQLTVDLTDAAAKSRVDISTHNLIRFEEEKSRIEVEKDSAFKATERLHKQQMDLLVRDHEFKDASNRLTIDSIAGLEERQLEKALETDLINARREYYAIEVGSDPAPLKEKLLADCDAKMQRIEARLNGLQAHRPSDSEA